MQDVKPTTASLQAISTGLLTTWLNNTSNEYFRHPPRECAFHMGKPCVKPWIADTSTKVCLAVGLGNNCYWSLWYVLLSILLSVRRSDLLDAVVSGCAGNADFRSEIKMKNSNLQHCDGQILRVIRTRGERKRRQENDRKLLPCTRTLLQSTVWKVEKDWNRSS